VDIGFSVAVLSGELRSRIPMTVKCINSINDQSYNNIEKILVNGGSPPHQTEELRRLGVDISDWKILDFPIDTMDSDNNWNMHRWTGAAALHASTKEFFFALNDDDFLSSNFFERIAALFVKYPSAGSAMGLKVNYNYDSGKYGEATHPKNLHGQLRPLIEPGLNLVRELFFKNNLGYGPSIGFQPVCRTEMVRQAGLKFFYEGFYPDCSPYFQVVARSDTIFDVDALMYWGVHAKQDQWKWFTKNYWFCHHETVYKNFAKNNIETFRKFMPNNNRDAKKIDKYFKKRIVGMSLFSITHKYSLTKFFKKSAVKISIKKPQLDVSFPLFKHLSIIAKRPVTLVKVVKENIKFL
jgi:glycosyltransferase involved in cell wall biosynthesis